MTLRACPERDEDWTEIGDQIPVGVTKARIRVRLSGERTIYTTICRRDGRWYQSRPDCPTDPEFKMMEQVDAYIDVGTGGDE